MSYKNAKNVKKGDTVYYINGKNEPTTELIIVAIEQEDKDIFFRCDNGKLYHHTALKT